MVQMATAIAVFSFLPYRQVRRGNIVVDTFTTWLPARANALIDAFWDLVYAGMMGLMTACLTAGTLEHYPQRPDHHAAADHRLAGDRHLHACSLLAHLRGADDGGQAGPGAPMSGLAIAGIGFGVMLLLIALRMPVGLSMLVVGSVGYIHLSSWQAFFAYMKINPYYQFANYTLSVIPLFILMGAFAEQSGMARDLFSAPRTPCRAHARRAGDGGDRACTVFGAICGSSVATTATFGRAALPELQPLQLRRRLCHRHHRRSAGRSAS